MKFDTALMSAREVRRGYASGKWTCKEAAEACLEVARSNREKTSAYVEIMEEAALGAAEESDRRYKDKKPLSGIDGIPVAVKDNMLISGCRATAGSAVLKDYVAPYDATAVRKLKDAGAVIIGITNMDEFAMGSSTETSFHGPTRNPWDTQRVPGGSSGGSAAAVAEGSAVLALGSDTGGSIRQPAGMCGVVGFKPTYGRVSRYGLIAMASSLDQIGPVARTVGDAADLLKVIEGHDPRDSTSVHQKDEWRVPEKFAASLEGVRVGVPKEYFSGGLDSEVEKVIRGAIEKLRGLGAEIREVSLPHTEYALAVYYVIMPCEASANLARFDGIRYGSRVPADTLMETYRKSRGRGFGKEVRRRIMLGTHALSSGYYDAYYLKALKVRRLLANDFAQVFQEVDVLAGPTAPHVAWRLGEKSHDPLSMYLSDIYTVSVNVVGLPAVSLPCGKAHDMPVGLQIIGRHFDDGRVLGVANAFERSAGWLAAGNRPSVN